MIPLFIGTTAQGASNTTAFSLVGDTTINDFSGSDFAHDDYYYIVGSDGAGLRSNDGLNWTPITLHSDTSAYFTSVASSFIGDKIVAVSLNGFIVSSSDGVTWTERVSSFNLFQGVGSSSSGKFVAVSETGSNRILISSNGDVWGLPTTSPAPTAWMSVANAWTRTSGDGLFCIVSNTGISAVSSDGGQVWTGGGSPPSGLLHVTFCADLDIFCAVGGGVVATSIDGLNWTTHTSPISSGLACVCWSREDLRFVACSSAAGPGTKLMTSTDGVTWTLLPHPPSSRLWNTISAVSYSGPEAAQYFVSGTSSASTKPVMIGVSI